MKRVNRGITKCDTTFELLNTCSLKEVVANCDHLKLDVPYWNIKLKKLKPEYFKTQNSKPYETTSPPSRHGINIRFCRR